MVEFIPALINTGVGAFTGAAVAFVGYLSNSGAEKFDWNRALPTFLIGLLGGAISGFISPDPKAAVIMAMSGDVLRKAVKNYAQAEVKKEIGV